jgi:hypothetical protein
MTQHKAKANSTSQKKKRKDKLLEQMNHPK